MTVDLVYDHYKETCQLVRDAEKSRTKNLFYLLITISILYLQIIQPSAVISMVDKVLIAKIGSSIEFSISVFQSFIWFIFFGILIAYYKSCVFIERQYVYIHDLEKNLQTKTSQIPSREGKSYLTNYPLFSEWIYYLFTWVFPILIIILVIGKIITEYYSKAFPLPFLVVNSIICILCVISTILFLRLLHWKK